MVEIVISCQRAEHPPLSVLPYSPTLNVVLQSFTSHSPPGMAFGSPMMLPPHMQEPARTTPYNQYPIRTTFVTMNIAPKTGNSSLVGGLLRKDTSTNVSTVPSETASWAYDQSSESDPAEDGSNPVVPTPAAARTVKGKSGYPRPKTNIRSTNSTFVTRVQSHDGFTKIVPNPPHLEGASPANFPPTRWAFTNTGRMLVWTLVDPTNKVKDPVLRVFFNNFPTCHTYCEATKSAPGAADGGRLDTVLGFNTGDVFW